MAVSGLEACAPVAIVMLQSRVREIELGCSIGRSNGKDHASSAVNFVVNALVVPRGASVGGSGEEVRSSRGRVQWDLSSKADLAENVADRVVDVKEIDSKTR